MTPEEFDAALAAMAVTDTNWRLGNYEILEEIGRGGMGVIYRARQRHSRRIVALKRVLSYHADSRDTLARFRREAEAAASLDHPNILPIYEVGESEDGVPFFSMKYAAGGSLQEVGPALREGSARDRAAGGEGYARGAIRASPGDSPSRPETGQYPARRPGRTVGERFRPRQMARHLERSDQNPDHFWHARLHRARAGRRSRPPISNRPPMFTAWARSCSTCSRAGRRSSASTRWPSFVRRRTNRRRSCVRSFANADRDLETICARCLEREPEARYRSAGDLAEDLERWLEGRPIAARPVLPPVQFWRWSRRNPVFAGGIAALAALLMFTSGLFTWHWHSQNLANAEIAKLRQGVMEFAQLEAQVCQPGEKKMGDEVYVQLASLLGIDAGLLRGKLPPFAAYLRRTSDASSYERANAAYVMKDYGEAERWAVQAANEARKVTPANPKAVIDALELAGLSAQAQIQYPRAMRHFRAAEKFSDLSRNSEEWANLEDEIADLLFAQGKFSDAEKLYRRVIELRSRVLGPEHPDTLASRNRLIYALNEEEKHAAAEAEARQVVKLREKILGFEHPDTLLSRYNLASALYHEGKFAEAERIYREVLQLDEKVIGPEHQRTLAARIGLANTLNDQGKYAEAIRSYREVIRLDTKVYGREHPVTLNDRMDLATALQANGQYPAAETEYRAVIKLQEKVLGPEHAHTLNTRNNLAELLNDEEKYAEAEAECRQILGLEEKALGPEHRLTLNSRANLAVALLGQGRIEGAQAQIGDVMKLMEDKLGQDYPDTVNFTVRFVNGLARQKKMAEAIDLAGRTEERARTTLGPNHPVTQKYAALLQALKNPK